MKKPKETLEVKIKLCGVPKQDCYYKKDYRVYDNARVFAQVICDYEGFPIRDKVPACGYKK